MTHSALGTSAETAKKCANLGKWQGDFWDTPGHLSSTGLRTPMLSAREQLAGKSKHKASSSLGWIKADMAIMMYDICLSTLLSTRSNFTSRESARSWRHCYGSSRQPHAEPHTPLLAWYQASLPRGKGYKMKSKPQSFHMHNPFRFILFLYGPLRSWEGRRSQLHVPFKAELPFNLNCQAGNSTNRQVTSIVV